MYKAYWADGLEAPGWKKWLKETLEKPGLMFAAVKAVQKGNGLGETATMSPYKY